MSETATPIWTCDFKEATGVPSTPLANLTVGSVFGLQCKGDIEVPWKNSPVVLNFPKEDMAFSLHVLKTVKLEAKNAEFLVVGYKPGQHKPEFVRVLQGENGFEFLKPEWTVQSVLKPNEQAQPYDSLGPWPLALPNWIAVLIGLILIVTIGLGVRFVRRHIQRKRMLEGLQKHKTVLSPLNQFYKDSRLYYRSLNHAKSAADLKALTEILDRDFRLLVLREFKIPTLEWSNRAIAEDLKRRHPVAFNLGGDALKKTLRELTRVRAQDQVVSGDLEQLHRMCLDTVEKLTVSKGARE